MTTGAGPTKDLRELLRLAIEHELNEWHVALPGKIESYDTDTNLASVKPTVSRRFRGAAFPTEYPVIPRVPIVQPETTKARIVFPIEVGDPVLLVFADRSIVSWLDSDGLSVREAEDVRQHHLSDAFAILGGMPTRAARAPKFPGAVNIEVAEGTKIAFTNGPVELLDLLEQMLTLLDTVVTNILAITQSITPTTGPTLSPLVNATDFVNNQTTIAQIKELLGELKA